MSQCGRNCNRNNSLADDALQIYSWQNRWHSACGCAIGLAGPQGSIGPQGPQGDPAPVASTYIQAQRTETASLAVPDTDNIPFNSINAAISYGTDATFSTTDFEFTIYTTGIYLFQWWMTLQIPVPSDADNLVVSLVNGNDTVLCSSGAGVSVLPTAQRASVVTGEAVISATAGDQFKLINNSGDTVNLILANGNANISGTFSLLRLA